VEADPAKVESGWSEEIIGGNTVFPAVVFRLFLEAAKGPVASSHTFRRQGGVLS